MTKPNIFDFILLILLSAILIFFLWSTHLLEVELAKTKLSHANFVALCQNAISSLSKRVHMEKEKCPTGVNGTAYNYFAPDMGEHN